MYKQKKIYYTNLLAFESSKIQINRLLARRDNNLTAKVENFRIFNQGREAEARRMKEEVLRESTQQKAHDVIEYGHLKKVKQRKYFSNATQYST